MALPTLSLNQNKYTKVVSLLFNLRTNVHIAHLQTRSYAAHKALNEIYDEILDIADSFCESAQGTQGILSGYTLGELNTGDIIVFIENKYNELLSLRKEFTEGHLVQLIDDANTILSAGLYKLKNLK